MVLPVKRYWNPARILDRIRDNLTPDQVATQPGIPADPSASESVPTSDYYTPQTHGVFNDESKYNIHL